MSNSPNDFRQLTALGLLSASIISFQIALMWLFSNTQWHHFASMIISMALLGFGGSGTCLTLFRCWFLKNSQKTIAFTTLLCSFFMAIAVLLSQWEPFRFDSMLLFSQSNHIFRLAVTYLLLFIPFFCGGLVIGLIFLRSVQSIGKLYFVNLFASGIGGLIVLLLFRFFSPALLPTVIAILPLTAAILFQRKKSIHTVLSCFVLSVVFIQFFYTPSLNRSEYKSIKKVLELPEAEILFEDTSPHGYMQIVSSPVLRYAPGLSLTYKNEIPANDVLFNNGEWVGSIVSINKNSDSHLYDYSPLALPYRIKQFTSVAVLQSGTGNLATHALSHAPQKVTLVEPNSKIVNVLNSNYPAESVYNRINTVWHPVDSYTYLLSTKEQYDLIVLPTLDSFGGSSGLFAMQEQYSLTQEAFGEMWQRLSPDGMISVSTWLDYPIRNPLRLLATFQHTLKEQNVTDYANHIAALRSWNMVSFVLKKSPFTKEEIYSIRKFAQEKNFDIVLLPAMTQEERMHYHHLQDDSFLSYIDKLLSDEAESFIQNYEFNISPTSENKPYFSQFLKLKHLPRLRTFFTSHSIPFLELGYLLLIVTLLQVILFSFLFILLPLVIRKWKGSHKWWTIIYFSALGLGFMFIEIVFIQRFILYFGNPLYSAAAVISAVLIFSGIGSSLTSRFQVSPKLIMICCLSIAALAIIYTLFLTPFLKFTISSPFLLKLLFTLLIIAPISFMMGMPFPLGLRLAEKTNSFNLSWAWSINGCTSVISAVLASIIAVEFGFVVVMISASAMYAFAVLITLFSQS